MESRDLFDLGLPADLATVRQSPLIRRDVLKLRPVGISALLAGCQPATSISTSLDPLQIQLCHQPYLLHPGGLYGCTIIPMSILWRSINTKGERLCY
jgi:hypothetical protein